MWTTVSATAAASCSSLSFSSTTAGSRGGRFFTAAGVDAEGRADAEDADVVRAPEVQRGQPPPQAQGGCAPDRRATGVSVDAFAPSGSRRAADFRSRCGAARLAVAEGRAAAGMILDATE